MSEYPFLSFSPHSSFLTIAAFSEHNCYRALPGVARRVQFFFNTMSRINDDTKRPIVLQLFEAEFFGLA